MTQNITPNESKYFCCCPYSYKTSVSMFSPPFLLQKKKTYSFCIPSILWVLVIDKWHCRHLIHCLLTSFFLYIVYLAEPNNIERVVVHEKGSIVTANQNDSITRLKRAAATAVSAAAVKAKFLGDQEEYHIRRLTALMIEKLVI
jgi:hypothetical protein